MSNKGSDENVAKIEEDVKYVKEMLEIARVFFKTVKAETDYKDVDEIAFCNAIKNILAEREQMLKPINTIEKDIRNIKYYINLVLNKGYCDCNELNVISTGKYCDGSKNVACSMQNLLVEREQDKKQIKEQEEEIENTTTNYKNLIADVSRIAKELGLEEYATIDEIYTAIRILKSKRINVIEQLDCIEVKNKEIDKLKAENKDLLRKLRNRVKQVKKLEKYSLYKSEFSRLNKQLKQKDKQIDLMAEWIEKHTKYYDEDGCYCEVEKEICKYDIECKDCIKQYFERKSDK